MSFKISVVMTAYNSENYLSLAIESVINQSLDFKRNIQIIIIDDASDDHTPDIAYYYQNKYPKNIFVLRNPENCGPAYSRNRGLGHVQGEFVNFLDSDDYITEYAFSKALSMFKKHKDVDIVSMPIYFFGARKGEHSLNYKYRKTQVVDLLENPECIQLSGPSAFFRYSKLMDYKFNEDLRVSEDPLLINQMLLDNPKIGLLDDCAYYYRKHDTQTSLIGSSTHKKSYYTSRVDNYFMALIDYAIRKYDAVPKFIQHVLMYDLQWIFEVRHVGHILDKQELIEFYAKLIKILSFIETDVIMFQKTIPGTLKTHIMLLKKHNVRYLSDKTDIGQDGCNHIEELGLNRIKIDICQIENDNLYIMGYFTTFSTEPNIQVKINDSKVMPVILVDFPQRDNYSLDFNYGFNHNFEVSIPLEENMEVSFMMDETPLIPEYGHISRLSNVSRYMLSEKYLVCDMDDRIQVLKRSAINTFKKEIRTLFNILRQRNPGWRTGFLLRLMYFIYYPFYKDKRIWLFMDLPYSADDNAFHLFKYMVEENISDVEKYFAISKHDYEVYDVEIMANKYQSSSRMFKLRRLLGLGNPSSEYQKIADIGFDIPYRSIRHRIYSLFAEAVVSSNPDNNIIYPFWGNFEYLAGLVRSKTVFLQHGVTKDDTSSWLNKYDKNLDLIVTVSDSERQSFIDNPYGYPKEAIQVLGFPRFDNLKVLEDKKEIVVMPTWRRHYNDFDDEDFVRTTFFNAFNNLLNDDELIEYLESKGYRMVFKPHPNLYRHIHLFDRHHKVEFIERSYNEIFNHSSLLVTDYSSVFFDFAYLEKPLIYYQYGRDYHFDVESGYFDYETMGFGPVTRTHEELKGAIMSYVSNGCEMEDMYKKRAEKFFKFRDHDNSKRVYEAISKIDFNH